MTIGTTYKQEDFDYSVRIVRIITRQHNKPLSRHIYEMEYVGVTKPNFTLYKEDIARMVFLDRWILEK